MSKRMHVPMFDRVVATVPKWLDANMVKPPCKRNPDALGTPVLIWPRSPGGPESDGFCYYGRRATGSPDFYLHGARIVGVTYWMPMPKGPPK